MITRLPACLMAARKVSASGRSAIMCAISRFRSRTDSLSSVLQKSRQYQFSVPALFSNSGFNSSQAIAKLMP
ncbi:hypothetical protein ALP29_201112 [Pseudomonas syringae pv. avii]|uniref:Uncharacterized protein n=1 Tax=Pseudomonas syringae pv. avii TaxID=663959 RepID=A0A3M5VI22_PSESX|nr:hypothetical protein ALP29_201112 [Pseudomonas syringae pv. avii]